MSGFLSPLHSLTLTFPRPNCVGTISTMKELEKFMQDFEERKRQLALFAAEDPDSFTVISSLDVNLGIILRSNMMPKHSQEALI